MGAGGALYILPILVSGYLLGLIFWPLRFFLIRLDGQRLFLVCAGLGVIWVSGLFSLSQAIKPHLMPWAGYLAEYVAKALPVQHSTKFLLSMLLALIVPSALNFIMWLAVGLWGSFSGRIDTASEMINRAAVRTYGGPLSRMLTRAADEQRMVMVTLSSRKVYCGYVLEIGPDVDRTGHIGILPVMSFTRDKDTLKFTEELKYHAVDVSRLQDTTAVDERTIRRLERVIRILPVLRVLSRILLVTLEVSQTDIEKKISSIRDRIQARQRTLHELSLGKRLVRKDWVKLIPVSCVESLSYYDDAATSRWFAPQVWRPGRA